MRVLYHHRTQGRGVEAVHIHGICSGFRALGCEVDIIGPPGIETDPNVVVHAEAGKTDTAWGWIARRSPQVAFETMEIGYNLAATPRIRRKCAEWLPDVICERYALYNRSGARVAKERGIPFILEVNDTVKVDRTRAGKSLKMARLARRFEKQIFGAAAGIVTVSSYLRDQVIATGIPADRVKVTPNAVDAAWFDPARVTGEAVRRRYKLDGDRVIGFTGSFTKWHRVDLLTDAFARLALTRKDLKLLLVGDGALMQETQKAVADLGISDRVIFTGKIPHGDVPEHLAAMDVAVMPESNVFGSPMKVFEYMAMAVPPVGPRYGPLEEAIDEGENGLIFEPRNVDALVASIARLLDSPDEAARLGAAARRKILERHQWSNNAEVVLELAGLRAPKVAAGAA